MIVPCSNGPFIFSKNEESTCIFFVFFYLSVKKNYLKLETKYDVYVAKGYATRERFLKRIRQNLPNLRKILSHDGLFSEIVIARHAQLNRI